MGISGAYAARRRNPLFAAAWDAALSIARERLADTLLARSMEGNIEQIYKDGELVGERHVLDNRLGLAILRRLDRLAEGGVSVSARDLPFSTQCRSPAVRPGAFNWEHAVEALQSGDDEGVAQALALVKAGEVEEVDTPGGGQPEQEERCLDLSDRCWKDGIDDIWMTDFPPPDGFSGYESRPYDDFDDDERYVRACTKEEAAILEADVRADHAAERAEDAELRDLWFACLRDEAARSLRESADAEDAVVPNESSA